jgi:hypothetical protein
VIERVSEALGCSQSVAIRWMLEDAVERGHTSRLLRSRTGRRLADQIVAADMACFKAAAAQNAISRAAPADTLQAEIKAHRASERAADMMNTLADRIARAQAPRPRRSVRPRADGE